MDINLSLLFWNLAKILLVMLFMAVGGATIFWAVREKTGALFQLDIWPDFHKQNMLMTYFFLMSSYVILVVSIGVCVNSSIIKYAMCCSPAEMVIGGMVSLAVLSACIETLPYTPGDQMLKISCWIVHSLTMAPALSFFGNYVTIQSMLYTTLGMILASLAGFVAPQNFYQQLKIPLSLLYIIVAGTTLASIFSCPNYDHFIEMLILEIAIYGGMVLYFAVALTNTQGLIYDIKTMKHFDPIFSSAVMFMCTVNLYMRIGLFLAVDTGTLQAVDLNQIRSTGAH